MAKKKIKSDRVLLQFSSPKQARAFYDYFVETGFDDFTTNDYVHDDLGKNVPECLTSNELPTEGMDNYYIELE